jgi:hypothetical protein
MNEEAPFQQTFNAQTQKLRSAVQQGESLSTRRSGPLGQIFFCDGCCCGRSEKGFPPLPKEMIKERWKSLKLNGTIQLTISGCLGPCDLANVFYLLAANGGGQWFGGLSEAWHYETLIQWASECQQSDVLLPIPETLSGHRFARFDTVPITPQLCTLSDRKLHEAS